MSYTRIIKTALRVTLTYPVLWVFGLFVVGGFNLTFFRFPNFESYKIQHAPKVAEVFYFFQTHPTALAAASLAVLLGSLASLFITNWSRIMLVLLAHSATTKKYVDVRECIKPSRSLLMPVVRLSLLSSFFMVAVGAVLLLPPLLLIENPEYQTATLVLAVAVLMPVAFTISCINIFGNLFLILFRQSLGKALNLATDFFVTKWTEIVAFCVLLFGIYAVCFGCGLAVIFFIQKLFEAAIELFPRLSFSATMTAAHTVSSLVVWALVGGLNVFVNTALLLLFLELTTPIEKEKEKAVAAVAAPAAVK